MDQRVLAKGILKMFFWAGFALVCRSAYAQPSGNNLVQPMMDSATQGIPGTGDYFAYVGTYTSSKSKGIYLYRFNARTGQFTSLGVAAEVANPSWVATDPRHRFLYAVTERGNDPASNSDATNGFVNSFAIDAHTGSLRFLNKVSSGGSGPAHLAVDHTGKILFVANYNDGRVVSFAIKPDGSIGESTGLDQHVGSSVNPQRQKGPHAHAVVLSPDNRFLFVPDLGLDKIMIYRVDAEKDSFTPNDPAFAAVNAGLGPRHLAFGAGAKFAYVICEMGSSVAVFSYDPLKGSLKPVQTVSTLPSDFKGESTSAEIEIDRPGKFLYASNRGNDSIAVFRIDPQHGTLEKIQVIPTGGKVPRSFAIDPTGNYLVAANQNSDQITVFDIDPKTGKLAPTRQVLDVPSPVCILFILIR